MFDDKLNLASLGTLKWAPFIMMAFNWWVMNS